MRTSIIMIAAVMLIAMASCAHRPKMIHVNPNSSSVGGCIEITASISDTLFDSSDLANYDSDSLRDPSQIWEHGIRYDIDMSQFKGPKVTFTLYNKCDTAYLLPTGGIDAGEYEFDDYDPVVGIELIGDSLTDGSELILISSPPCWDEEYIFSVINANDSLKVIPPVDVLIYYVWRGGYIPRGDYRVRIVYTSQCAPRDGTTVWIGRAKSEWLDFRIE